jgi:hypothetical protein
MSGEYVFDQSHIVFKKIPSADPDVKRALEELRADPQAYFERQRAASEQQALAEMERKKDRPQEPTPERGQLWRLFIRVRNKNS